MIVCITKYAKCQSLAYFLILFLKFIYVFILQPGHSFPSLLSSQSLPTPPLCPFHPLLLCNLSEKGPPLISFSVEDQPQQKCFLGGRSVGIEEIEVKTMKTIKLRQKTESMGRALQWLKSWNFHVYFFFTTFIPNINQGEKVTKDFTSMIHRITHTVNSGISNH